MPVFEVSNEPIVEGKSLGVGVNDDERLFDTVLRGERGRFLWVLGWTGTGPRAGSGMNILSHIGCTDTDWDYSFLGSPTLRSFKSRRDLPVCVFPLLCQVGGVHGQSEDPGTLVSTSSDHQK